MVLVTITSLMLGDQSFIFLDFIRLLFIPSPADCYHTVTNVQAKTLLNN